MSAGMVAAEASKGMGLDEESFNVPVPVAQKVRASYLQLLSTGQNVLFQK